MFHRFGARPLGLSIALLFAFASLTGSAFAERGHGRISAPHHASDLAPTMTRWHRDEELENLNAVGGHCPRCGAENVLADTTKRIDGDIVWRQHPDITYAVSFRIEMELESAILFRFIIMVCHQQAVILQTALHKPHMQARRLYGH